MNRPRRNRVSITVGVLLAVIAGYHPAPSVLAANVSGWAYTPSTALNTACVTACDTTLHSVVATSPRDAWAIADSIGAIIHWDGLQWASVASAQPGDILYGLTATGANDAWVGGYQSRSGTQGYPLIEHWNGSIWTDVAAPNPYPGNPAIIMGMKALSSTDVWAVGYTTVNGFTMPLTEHWNGASWQVISTPDMPTSGAMLFAVSGTSSNDVWAVGTNAPTSIIAPSATLIEHWNGQIWSVSPSTGPIPTPQSQYLNSVTAVSATNAWAVGTYITFDAIGTMHVHSLVEHWNGSVWSASTPLSQVDSLLNGVAALSANDIWAVGLYYSPGADDQAHLHPLFVKWDGTSWQPASPTVDAPGPAFVNAVAQVGNTGQIWAVGRYIDGTGMAQAAIYGYSR